MAEYEVVRTSRGIAADLTGRYPPISTVDTDSQRSD
jgi:hypothetical protein